MSPTHPQKSASGLFFGAMVVMVLLAIGFGGYESSQARQAEASLAAEREKHEADEAQLRQLSGSAKAASDRIAALQAALQQQTSAGSQASQTAANAAKAAKPASAAAQEAKAKALADGQEFLATYGQSRDMLISIGKAQVARNFSGFIRSGAVTPAQIDELETRTSEHWLQSLAVAPNSVHPTDPNLSDAELKGILGEQGFQQFQDYGRMQPLLGMVNDISSMSITAPLSIEQSTQLLSVLAGASSTYQSGGKANPQSIDWNQAMAQAQGVLSEPQFNALKAEAQLPQLMDLVKQFYQARAPAK
jgi:hypothetical protein